jgi:diguanylate cyclase
MSPQVFELVYGLAGVLLGASAASWSWWLYLRRQAISRTEDEPIPSATVSVRVHELKSHVAFGTDERRPPIEIGESQPPGIDVAALVEANRSMQEKLAWTEDRLREQLQELQTHTLEARTDGLTSLANRRALDDELIRRIAEFRRLGHAFSLIMADVDGFKALNDTHGHPLGDEVLRRVGELLRHKFREMDMVARYGGEEFAVVLPGTTLNDACNAATRACEAMGKHTFLCGGKDLRVTMSFGVAEVLGNEDGNMLVSRADRALYAAKEAGRNCAHRHDGETVSRIDPSSAPVNAPLGDRDKNRGISSREAYKQTDG